MNKHHIMEILQTLVKPLNETSLEIDLNKRILNITEKYPLLHENSLNLEINDTHIKVNDHSICKYLFMNIKIIQLLINEINLEIKKFENSNLNTCSPDVLNLNQEKLIALSLDLCFSFGIQPLLSDGTIIEIDVIKSLKKKFKAENILNSWKNIENDQKSLILKNCCFFFNLLLSEENQIEFFKRIIISKHLNYLLVLYIEVIYSPLISKYLKKNFENDYAVINFNLNKICQSFNQCNIMRELVILQTIKPISKDSIIKAPLWFKRACHVILKELIMNKFGLKALILALLPQRFGSEDQGHFFCDANDINWKRIYALAKIAADLPIDINLQDYYKNISNQILDILKIDDYKKFKTNPKDKLLINVLMKIISIMYSKDAKSMEEILISKIFAPFEFAIKLNKKELTIVDDQTLCNFVTFLDQVFIPNMEPNSPLIKTFNKYLDYFFKLYLFSQTGISYMKCIIEKITLWIFNLMSPKDIVFYFYSCFFSLPCNQLHFIEASKMEFHFYESEIIINMDADYKYVNTSNGLIELILDNSSKIDSNYYSSGWVIDILMNFISSLKAKNEVAIDFIILLLEKLTKTINNDIIEDSKIFNDIHINTLGNSSNNFGNKIFLFDILSGLSEKFEEITTENKSKIIDLAKLNLERGVAILNSTNEKLTEIFISETLTLAMGLLTAVFTDRTSIKEEDWIRAESLLPLLNQLSEKHELEEVREMALDLNIALATHGIFKLGKQNKFIHDNNIVSEIEKENSVICTDIKSNEQLLQNNNRALSKSNKVCKSFYNSKVDISDKSKKILIEELESIELVNISADTLLNSDSHSDKSRLNSDELSDKNVIFKENPDKELSKTDEIKICKSEIFKTQQFEEISQLLSDPSIPARGHGLILLRRQIEYCGTNIIPYINSLYEVSRLNLLHDDSYIYLNAILVISALGNICPQVVVGRIAKEYGDDDQNIKAEVRLKLGEVLVKIVDQLGELVPIYKNILISSVLSCIKKHDGIVKASGVENLGQICHYLHFSFGTIIYEVLECIESLIKYEKHAETRRAAVHFTTQLLRGLSQDTFQVIGDKLLDLYRVLKFCQSTDTDEIVQLHVEQSIQELDIIIKKWLTTSQSLEKQLYVIDYPSNNFTF